ncbi:hypothetical protein QYF61_023102, partial [Mycteria americana]
MNSSWRPIISDVSLGPIPCPALVINDLDDRTPKCTTKLGVVTDTPNRQVAIQRDLERVQKWSNRNLIKFNNGNNPVLPLEKNNHMHQYKLGTNWVGSSFAEKALGSRLSWFSPSRQLSTTQPLAHSPLVGWGRESEEQNTNPKHSPIPATTKKINSVSAETRTVQAPVPAPVQAGDKLGGKQLCREGPGLQVNTKMLMRDQCTPAEKSANSLLGCIMKSIASRVREVILPLYPALVEHNWNKGDMDILWWVQGRATKTIKSLECLLYEARLRKLGLFSLKKALGGRGGDGYYSQHKRQWAQTETQKIPPKYEKLWFYC